MNIYTFDSKYGWCYNGWYYTNDGWKVIPKESTKDKIFDFIYNNRGIIIDAAIMGVSILCGYKFYKYYSKKCIEKDNKFINDFTNYINSKEYDDNVKNITRNFMRNETTYSYFTTDLRNITNDGTNKGVGKIGVTEPSNLYVDDGLIRFIPNTSDEYVSESDYSGVKL